MSAWPDADPSTLGLVAGSLRACGRPGRALRADLQPVLRHAGHVPGLVPPRRPLRLAGLRRRAPGWRGGQPLGRVAVPDAHRRGRGPLRRDRGRGHQPRAPAARVHGPHRPALAGADACAGVRFLDPVRDRRVLPSVRVRAGLAGGDLARAARRPSPRAAPGPAPPPPLGADPRDGAAPQPRQRRPHRHGRPTHLHTAVHRQVPRARSPWLARHPGTAGRARRGPGAGG